MSRELIVLEYEDGGTRMASVLIANTTIKLRVDLWL